MANCRKLTFTFLHTIESSFPFKSNSFQEIKFCQVKQKENFGCGVVAVSVNLQEDLQSPQKGCRSLQPHVAYHLGSFWSFVSLMTLYLVNHQSVVIHCLGTSSTSSGMCCHRLDIYLYLHFHFFCPGP